MSESAEFRKSRHQGIETKKKKTSFRAQKVLEKLQSALSSYQGTECPRRKFIVDIKSTWGKVTSHLG